MKRSTLPDCHFPPTVCVVLAAVLTIASVPGSASDASASPSRYSGADEAVYLQRFERLTEAFRTGLGLETYDPLEAVPGAARYQPWPVSAPPADGVLGQALAAGREYAARNRSGAFMVWHRGRLLEASYFGDMRADATFPSRSLAKPMTAAAIGRAIALGRIRSLDQPVADFLVEWRDDPRRSKILVRHLLDMRSGFLPQAAATTAEDILNRSYLHPRHEEVILYDYPVVDEPGTRYEYNNATSELVALVIERATGQRYAQFVGREILAPIGAPGGEVWVNRPGGLAHSGCCMMLPPEAWLRLGVLFMQDGVWQGRRLLPRGYVAQMRQGTAQNPWYGLGVYASSNYIRRRPFANPVRVPPESGVLHSEPYVARDLFLFDGNGNQVVYVVPSAQLVVLRIGGPPPRSAEGEWDNTKLPNLLLRALYEAQPALRRRAPGPQPRPDGPTG
jgi:CubicO group peptidase (beta-lactamase class C family)